MRKNIAVMPGDGIGPEITGEALRVLSVIGERYGHTFETEPVLAGGRAIDETGEPLPELTVKTCLAADAVLLGAVGGPKWDGGVRRPEEALLGIRKAMGLFANLRPAKLFDALSEACPVKDLNIDMLIVRELTGGIYFGKKGREADYAFDTMEYTVLEIERISRVAFEAARKRDKRLVSVDKANVLSVSKLWREVVSRVAKDYPDVACSHMLVDNAAMQLVRRPSQFDVMVTGNLFGDILSDEAAMLTGSIGMLPSASLGEGKRGLFEPIHGSAPDIAGKSVANPLATILSTAMMLKYSLDMPREADAIERAVEKTLKSGARTADIAASGQKFLSTVQMTEEVIKNLRQ